MVYTSQISGFEDLEQHLDFAAAALLIAPLNNTLQSLEFDDPPQHFRDLVCRFLKGTGIPCPQKFNEAKAHFSGIADLNRINQAGFRAHILCWAVSGSPFLDITMIDKISVRFSCRCGDLYLIYDYILQLQLCADDDNDYATSHADRRALIKTGTICFKTCIKLAKIPASHIQMLAKAVYPSPDEPELATFYHAFDHWFLCQLLNVVGTHTIL